MAYINPMRKLLQEKQAIVGATVLMREPVVTEFLAQYYDYIWLDYEHSWMDKSTLVDHMIAARAGGNTPVVIRVPSEFPAPLKAILDMGPAGIVFPMISTVEQAKTAVAACTYAPRGVRGYYPQRVCFSYDGTAGDYHSRPEEYVYKILQIESKQGVENIEEILQLPGVDCIAVGPADMSCSIGQMLKMDDPELVALLERLAAAVTKAGIPLMVPAGDPTGVAWWKQRGARIFFAGSDIGFILGGAKSYAEQMRKWMNG